MFDDRWKNVHNKKSSGKPSLVANKLKARIGAKIQKDRVFTIDVLLNEIHVIVTRRMSAVYYL